MINDPVKFTNEHQSLIKSKLESPDFTHKEWGSEELEDIRRVIRNHYRNVQNGLCAYCKNNLSLQSVGNCHAEHIAPKSIHRKFMFHPKNLCVICSDCNTIKRDQEIMNDVPEVIQNATGKTNYPRSSGAFKIVHPHYDNWDDHIIKIGNHYTDKSKKGSFTIHCCSLNRFYHKFGYEEVYINDADICNLMTKFLEADTGIVERARLLSKLKAALIVAP